LKTKTAKQILLSSGLIALIIGLGLIGLVVADVKPLSLFYSQNNVYAVDLTPISATVAVNQSQLFSTTLKFDDSSHQISYHWMVDGNTVPLYTSSMCLVYGGPGSYPIVCQVTVDGTTTINCYATLTVTGGSTYIAPTAPPISNQMLDLLPTKPLLVALGAVFSAFGSMAVLISRKG
jgi:hypothetical protein